MLKSFLAKITGNKNRETPEDQRAVVLSLRLKTRAHRVTVAGSFNRWSPFSHPLRLSTSGAWETTLRLTPGVYRYRFLIDSSTWALDPSTGAAPNEYGGTDSLLVVAGPQRKATLVREYSLVEQYA